MDKNILYMDKLINIDIKKLYEELINFEFCKINENKITENVIIKDFKLDIDIIKQNEYYEKYPNLNKYLTRGLSFLILNNEVSLWRKGFRKFFMANDNININKNDNYSWLVMRKEDGMNIQITYSNKLKSLVICSKFISIVCNNLKELDKYKDKLKYSTAYLIAKFFFNNYKVTDRLLEILDEYVLLGEYIGKRDNLLVEYFGKEDIKFFTLIRKNFTEEEKPLEYWEILKQLNLNLVEYEYLNKINYNEINEIIKNIQNKSLLKFGEGKVFYLLKDGFLINMYKIKTKEFGFFFNLKDKILNHNFNMSNIFDNFPQPPDFYKKIIAEFKNLKFNKSLVYQYFSLILINIIQKIQSENKIKLNIEELYTFSNIQNFKTIKNKTNYQKEVVLIIPCVIPGSGKSYYREKIIKEFILNNGFNFEYISSDEITEHTLKETKEANKNKNYSQEKIYQLSKKKSTKIYNNKLFDLISNYNDDKVLFIYCDKNHIVINNILEAKKNFNFIKTISLTNILNIDSQIKFNNKIYPFDYNYIICVIRRLINRENHETLNNGINHTLKIMFNFLNLYKNLNIQDICKDLEPDHYYFEINFVENNKFKKYNEIQDLIKIILSKISFKINNELDSYFEELINLVNSEDLTEISKEKVLNNFNKDFFNFLMKFFFINKSNNQKNQNSNKPKTLYGKKNPIYYGIFFDKFPVNNFLNNHNIYLLEDDYNNLKNIPNLHVTCEYFGFKATNINSKNYILNLSLKIFLEKIIYVENLCIIIQVSVNDNRVKINNKHPHITYSISKNFKPVESNNIWELINNKDNIYEINYKKKIYNIFIESSKLILTGVTKFYYN